MYKFPTLLSIVILNQKPNNQRQISDQTWGSSVMIRPTTSSSSSSPCPNLTGALVVEVRIPVVLERIVQDIQVDVQMNAQKRSRQAIQRGQRSTHTRPAVLHNLFCALIAFKKSLARLEGWGGGGWCCLSQLTYLDSLFATCMQYIWQIWQRLRNNFCKIH